MPLAIRVTHDPGRPNAVRIVLEGSLDAATSADLEKEIDQLLAGPLRFLALDLAGLKFVSSAGIRVLMKARQGLTDRGGVCAMTNLQPQVAKVFEIVKALPGVSIFRNEKEMDDYLAAMQRKFLEGDGSD
jgi:anti-anti-sigma factor